MDIVVETPRLIIRKMTLEDVNSLLPIIGDPEVMRFSINGPLSREGIQKFVDATIKRYANDGVGQWAVLEKASDQFIGTCGISVQAIDGKSENEIGYRFSHSLWGKGFATEAASACRDYGFAQCNFARFISIIESENHASIRVAEKMGMALEKKSSFHGIPVCIYSIERNVR